MATTLTESAIRSAIKRAKDGNRRVELTDAQTPGLRLRVTAGGGASWGLACRDQAKAMRRYKLGDYPAITIAKAREQARELRGDVRRGADPIAEKRAKAEANRAKAERKESTVQRLVEQWEAKHLAKRSTRYRGEAVRALTVALKKDWTKAAADLDRAAVRKALDALSNRTGTKGMVGDRSAIQRRTAAYGSACFGWALERELVVTNPFLAIPLPEAAPSRDRVLTDAELAEVLQAAGIKSSYGRIIWLLATTGQRASEVGGMRWEELSADLKTWTVPGARMKNRKAHVVPISDAARVAFKDLERPENGKGLVFPSSAGTPFARWSECKLILDLAIQKTRNMALGVRAEAIPLWRVHDLRRTLATGLEALGIRMEVTEAVIGHVSGKRSGIVAVYQRHEYGAEKRVALDTWGARVATFVTGEQAESDGNVVILRRVG